MEKCGRTTRITTRNICWLSLPSPSCPRGHSRTSINSGVNCRWRRTFPVSKNKLVRTKWNYKKKKHTYSPIIVVPRPFPQSGSRPLKSLLDGQRIRFNCNTFVFGKRCYQNGTANSIAGWMPTTTIVSIQCRCSRSCVNIYKLYIFRFSNLNIY